MDGRAEAAPSFMIAAESHFLHRAWRNVTGCAFGTAFALAGAALGGCSGGGGDKETRDSPDLRRNSVSDRIRHEEVWRQDSADKFPDLSKKHKILRGAAYGVPITF